MSPLLQGETAEQAEERHAREEARDRRVNLRAADELEEMLDDLGPRVNPHTEPLLRSLVESLRGTR